MRLNVRLHVLLSELEARAYDAIHEIAHTVRCVTETNVTATLARNKSRRCYAENTRQFSLQQNRRNEVATERNWVVYCTSRSHMQLALHQLTSHMQSFENAGFLIQLGGGGCDDDIVDSTTKTRLLVRFGQFEALCFEMTF
jgi:hypothetical protein